jgi:hypothetical protein
VRRWWTLGQCESSATPMPTMGSTAMPDRPTSLRARPAMEPNLGVVPGHSRTERTPTPWMRGPATSVGRAGRSTDRGERRG